MMWLTNMPSVMPPCDFQAYTMPVDSDVTTLYTLEYKDGDTILRTDHLPSGDIVFMYAAPDGKRWMNTPRNQNMPARNWTVYTQEACPLPLNHKALVLTPRASTFYAFLYPGT